MELVREPKNGSNDSSPHMSKREISNKAVQEPVTAKKRTRVPRGTPTKAALQRAAAAEARTRKQTRRRDWERRCKEKRWTPNPRYTQPRGTRVMHHAAAQRYFRLTRTELGRLPYIEFFNKHHEVAPPGKSYEYARLLRLVHYKFASLAGLPKNAAFVARGKALFDAYAATLDARRVKLNKKARSPEI
ncbi:hypothetical protein B0H17DRAFT_1179983 [Mycena rosella]|uniref:Uncharacterized protein n=1 Tax=Mycena rosella TaxID=1033263 RepID=A0AAD7DI08_MYCRO|nr:hypothetical protein B0H17DRAFT_1179983 [Mycena rosella]